MDEKTLKAEAEKEKSVVLVDYEKKREDKISLRAKQEAVKNSYSAHAKPFQTQVSWESK